MAEVRGVVQEIQERPVAGGKTAFNVVVGGQAYGAGLFRPKVTKGQYVQFEVDDSRGYKNIGRGSLKVSDAKEAPADAVAEAVETMPKKSTTGGSFDWQQDVISRQAASNTAIAFMGLLQAAGALPKATGKGKDMEVLETILHKYEEEFYERNTGIKYKNISPSISKNGGAEVDEAEVVDDKWD